MVLTGQVAIVGAGPGDAGLLTRRGAARLRTADLVLYDALVDRRLLRLARRARRRFVGKRAGRQAVAQRAIEAQMIRAARAGLRVVRLKGGDPFVFGRGGEEAIALRAAGVPFEVVPGVTSAIAAPALAGIPVTHRGASSGLLVISGHDEEVFAATTAGLAHVPLTLVILMGFARRVELAKQLIAAGWRAETPAAIVSGAATPDQQIWRGTLAGVGGAPLSGATAAATMVVGAVAALRCESALGGGEEATA